MLIFAVPFNVVNINQPFIKAFKSISRILARSGVHLIVIDCRFRDQKHLREKVQSIVNWVDGIIFPGNPYSIDPRIYGESTLDPKRVDPEPKNFEFAKLLIDTASAKTIPILGICGGSWYLNVARGGTLLQDISHLAQEEKHVVDSRDGRVSHEIKIARDTRLYSIFGTSRMRVNSWHDQAIKKPGRDLIISARSPNGIPEAIEGEGDSFFVGIQFHPEYLLGGELCDGHLSREDIAKQQSIFKKMAEAAVQRQQALPENEETEKAKEIALAFHQANTVRLLNVVEHRGKIKVL